MKFLCRKIKVCQIFPQKVLKSRQRFSKKDSCGRKLIELHGSNSHNSARYVGNLRQVWPHFCKNSPLTSQNPWNYPFNLVFRLSMAMFTCSIGCILKSEQCLCEHDPCQSELDLIRLATIVLDKIQSFLFPFFTY